QHLEKHERDGHRRERGAEPAGLLHRRNECTHRDGEYRWQDAAQDQRRPPGSRERAVSLGQDGEELPFFTLGDRPGHCQTETIFRGTASECRKSSPLASPEVRGLAGIAVGRDSATGGKRIRRILEWRSGGSLR